MEDTILTAVERTRQGGKFREKGFVAGVVYGEGVNTGKPVKFDAAALQRILKRYGSNARVTVRLDNHDKAGIIKEIQRDAISRQITHVDVQLVSKDQEVKLQIPLIFRGVEELAERQLQLLVQKHDVTVTGRMDLMPEAIHIDVAAMNLGDSITADNFNLHPQLKVSEKEEVVYAVINSLAVGEAPEAEAPAGTGEEAAASDSE